MSEINPITELQKQQVLNKAEYYMQQLQTAFDISIPKINIHFDLKGRCAGMYVVRKKQRHIRFNSYIFSKYFQNSLITTVPHEIAHYVSDLVYGIKNIKPHGKEWQSIMHTLNVEPRVTGDYDLTGIPVRRQQRFEYQCTCMTHQLTSIRHNRVQQGRAYYLCQKCKSPIELIK